MNGIPRVALFAAILGGCASAAAELAEFPPVAPVATAPVVSTDDAAPAVSALPNEQSDPAPADKASAIAPPGNADALTTGVEEGKASPQASAATAKSVTPQVSLPPPAPPPPEAEVAPAVDVRIEPGVNEIIPVAIGHLNRVVTPFTDPELRTTSDADTTVRGSVIYVAPKSEAPVTFFVTPKGEESVALSITLVPRRIPPREIRLSIGERWMEKTAMPSPDAGRWEKEHPYVDVITATLRDAALGALPQGYTLRPLNSGVIPRCVAPNAASLAYSFASGQLLQGNSLRVLVGVVTNSGVTPVELQEQWCSDTGVAAVAYWPRVVLAPGERTEVFVAMRIDAPRGDRSARPSLVQ